MATGSFTKPPTDFQLFQAHEQNNELVNSVRGAVGLTENPSDLRSG